MFLASAATVVATLVARMPLPLPLHELRDYHLLDELRDYHFFDLNVYRRAAEAVNHGRPLYTTRFSHGLGFTYPPLAALIFLALRWLPVRGDELMVTIVNVALVAAIAFLALGLSRQASGDAVRARGGRGARSGRGAPGGWRGARQTRRSGARQTRRRVTAGLLAAAVVLWVEPVTTTLGYGQIDLLITALVVVDLACGRDSRAGGLGIGLAAALKLTPLVFIPYLAFTGRGRMAARALGAFGLAIAIEFAAVPGDAWSYWFGGKFIDVSRVTGGHPLAGSGAANQSLRGALLRIIPGAPHMTLIWLLACILVGGSGLLLAVRAARRGDEAWGFMLTALTGLLTSPVSWTHHWAIGVAGALAVLGSGRLSALKLARAAAAIAVGLCTGAIWLDIQHRPLWSHAPVGTLLLGNAYVLAGLIVLVLAAALDLRHAARPRTRAVHLPRFAPAVSAALTATPPLVRRVPGHPGDPVRAITTSQALAPDRQSL